eukprot:Gb_29450 [translate_table: standard]
MDKRKEAFFDSRGALPDGCCAAEAENCMSVKHIFSNVKQGISFGGRYLLAGLRVKVYPSPLLNNLSVVKWQLTQSYFFLGDVICPYIFALLDAALHTQPWVYAIWGGICCEKVPDVTSAMQVATGQVASTGIVALSYVQRVSEKVSLASDFMYNHTTRDATTSFGYDYLLRQFWGINLSTETSRVKCVIDISNTLCYRVCKPGQLGPITQNAPRVPWVCHGAPEV